MQLTRRDTLKFGLAGVAGVGTMIVMPFQARAAMSEGDNYMGATGEITIHPISHASFVMTAPGIVTVLILPSLPESRPEPTDGLRRLVAEWLNSHRLLGSRIEVVGPVYVPVTVRADIGIEDGAIGPDVIAAVSERIDRFLDPLAGGPDGTGWPFGRDIYRSELLQTIDETPGVSFVRRLEIVDGAGHASCGNLCIGPLGLPDGQAHEIRIADRSER